MNRHLISRLWSAAFAALACALLCDLPCASAASFSDNFNDQSDSAWTEFNPLAALGIGSYTFPQVGPGNYAYNISAAAQTPYELLETQTPSMAASFYEGLSFTSFDESVDILNWEMNPSEPTEPLDEAVGLLGRMTMTDNGPDGYALTLSPHSQQLLLSTIVNGDGTTIDIIPVTLDSSDAYHLEFTGVGDVLSGTVTDQTDPTAPAVTFQFTDSTFSQGWGGLLSFDNSNTGVGESTGCGATYDNYAIDDVPEPTSIAGLGLALMLVGSRMRPRSGLAPLP